MKIYLLLLFILPGICLSQDKYVTTTALQGDGVLSILRRYQLAEHSCNSAEFYRINGMEVTDLCIKGKEYKIPILLVTYNSKSICSSLKIENTEKCKAIDLYNQEVFKKKIKTKSIQQSKMIWVPYHILNCDPKEDSQEPETENLEKVTTANYQIFGPNYKTVKKESNKLAGQVFYIVSGHGGPDPGAIGLREGNSLCEDEYAYDVCLRLTRYLCANGGIAYMIVRDPNDGIRDESYLKCDEDEKVYGDRTMSINQKKRLFDQAVVINRLYFKHLKQGIKKQCAINIHVDAIHKNIKRDIFLYHDPTSSAGKKIALAIQKLFDKKYKEHQSKRGFLGTVSPRVLFMLRETIPTSVYIELGNIKNSDDQRRIILVDNRTAVAKWIYEALLKAW